MLLDRLSFLTGSTTVAATFDGDRGDDVASEVGCGGWVDDTTGERTRKVESRRGMLSEPVAGLLSGVYVSVFSRFAIWQSAPEISGRMASFILSSAAVKRCR